MLAALTTGLSPWHPQASSHEGFGLESKGFAMGPSMGTYLLERDLRYGSLCGDWFDTRVVMGL